MEINFNTIKKQIKSIVRNSQGIEDPKIEDLVEKWYQSKKNFIEAFGGLIWESPEVVTFPIGESLKKKKVYDFADYIAQTYQNFPLTAFIEDNAETFFQNRMLSNKDYYGTKIPKGMKIVKAFKYFEEDKGVLNKLQMEASRIIQEDKIEGKLCFSVHPLDFLSSSENTYNWRSCHALDGDYRSGNLSYMLDNSTIICYLKGEDNVILPAFGAEVPWNSKKWRALFYFSDKWDIIAPGRQYPFSSNSGISQVCDTLLNILDGHNGISKENFSEVKNVTHSDRGRIFSSRAGDIPLSSFIFDILPALHYNDLLHSSCYDMKYVENRRAQTQDFFHIGANVRCLECGERYIQDSNTMRCPFCECEFGTEDNDTYGFCDCCGARGYRDDFYFVENDMICPSCFENNCSICEVCGEAVYESSIIYDRRTDEYVCKYCYRDRYEN